MIKGIIALFTSGAIFNPFVLLGIISGVWALLNLKPEEIRGLFANIHFYTAIALAAVVYTFIFAKIYKEGGEDIDWSATCGRAVWNFAKYFLAFVLSMSFVTMISFF